MPSPEGIELNYGLEYDLDGREKWIKIQMKMLKDYKEGILEEDVYTREAFQFCSMILSGKYINTELTEEVIQFLASWVGNVKTINTRLFDEKQMKAINLLQEYSKLYNKKFGIKNKNK